MVAQRMAADVVAIARDWPLDVVVRELNEFGGYVAAEGLGLPHATVQVSTFQPFYWRDDALSRQLDRWRAEYGLPADPGLGRLYHYLFLSCEPPGFHDPNVALPRTTHALRLPPFDRSEGDLLPTWAEHLPTRRTVYVTFGTIVNRRPGIFEPVLDALKTEDLNLIVTVGPNRDPAELGPRPSNVHVERYIPQTLLFPRCDLVVCHGGRNTVLAALSYGLPLLLIPLSADQPDNAKKCVALGVARVIEPSALSTAAVRAAALDLLDDPSYRRSAQRQREAMAAQPGVERAVELIERVTLNHSPA